MNIKKPIIHFHPYSAQEFDSYFPSSNTVLWSPFDLFCAKWGEQTATNFGRIIICLKGILRVFCIIFGLLTTMLLSHCTLVSFGANFKGLLLKTITHLYNILISPKSKEPQKVYSIHQCFIVVLSREYVDVVY